MMESPTVDHLCQFLETLAPAQLAEEWDNVGLLVGDRNDAVRRVMTCLTITPESADEAMTRKADLVITHHPLPFRAFKSITTDTVPGTLLWNLIRHGIAIYSPHTAFDSAEKGINQALATGLHLTDIRPLVISEGADRDVGSGRYGVLSTPMSLSDLSDRLKGFLAIEQLKLVGTPEKRVQTVAVACGAAGQFLTNARAVGCDVLVLGETNFHTCLEARATGVSLLLPGHYASERFAVEQLAATLAAAFPTVETWASEQEHDPVLWN